MARPYSPSCRRRRTSAPSGRHLAQASAPQIKNTIIVSTKAVEDRHEPRYSSQLEIHLSELTPTNETLVALTPGSVANLSRHGLCVNTPRPLTPCSCVRCEISLPGTPVQLPTLMQVRWVKEIAESVYQCGLSYLL